MDLYMAGYDGFIAIINCKKCGRCVDICSNKALIVNEGTVEIDHENCDLCLRCTSLCQSIIYIE